MEGNVLCRKRLVKKISVRKHLVRKSPVTKLSARKRSLRKRFVSASKSKFVTKTQFMYLQRRSFK